MSLKKLGVAVLTVLALGAVMASSAFAAPGATGKSKWYVAGTALTSGSSAAVKCHITNVAVPFKLNGEVGEAPKVPVELTATGVNCLEGKITQEGTAAVDSGKLEFTGVTVMKPEGCSVVSPVTTKALKTELYMDASEPSKTYDKFEPALGPTEKFATVEISGCAAAGSFAARGSVYGLANRATGEFATTQNLTFSVQSYNALTLAGNPASITGEATNELVENTKTFGAKES